MGDDLLLALPTTLKLASDGRPVMMGGQCTSCGLKVFPKPMICHSCWSETIDDVELARSGKLYSYSVVHAARKGWPSPYAIAYVDLDDGVRVCGQLDRAPDVETPLDAKVMLTLGPLREGADGKVYHAHRFVLVEAAHA